MEEIVAKYKLKSRSHVHNLVRKSAAIKRDYENGNDPNRKSLKQSSIPGLDDHIKNFIRSSTSRGVPISRRIISTENKLACQKKYGKQLKGSQGHISNLIKRIDASVKKTHGQANAVDENVISYWEAKLPAMVQNYAAKDVFNMDELGLFYELLPASSYVIGKDRLKATKTSKLRLTVLLGANADGSEKLTPLIIGKSKKPRCFKSMKPNHLPVLYRSNATVWMTSLIFTEYLSNWNKELKKKKNRKVLLFYDGHSSHPERSSFSNNQDDFVSTKCNICFATYGRWSHRMFEKTIIAIVLL